jgi:biopolymer transport protein ExbD
MDFNSWQRKDGVEHEVNMTPLIDVALVLVVMLLLATPLAFESSIGVRNETTTAQKAQAQDQIDRIEVVVVNNDFVRVNEIDVSRHMLSETLKPMLASSIDRTVMIGCEKGVTHGTFVDVLDQAKIAGAVGIAVFER